ncbi:MAG: hypothetical protein ACOC5T_01355 [Elusimicrobiota bacterium]
MNWYKTALKQNIYDNLLKWWENEDNNLSFDHIFGDKTRIVIPLIDKNLRHFIEKIENIKDPKTGKSKNYKVDLPRGVVIETGLTEQGKPFRREKRIGKVVQKEMTQNDVDFWSRYASGKNSYISNYAIVVSRNPIDVIRMSDHDKIKSCHAPGRSYFDSAKTEAQGHGPVAYLIEKDDLKKIPNLQALEIFTDKQRNITENTIEPISRIRLREFKDPDGKEILIPEKKVYGDKAELVPILQDSITHWARQVQPDFYHNPPNPQELKEYVRLGGNYTDTNAGEMFNNFFDTNKYKGVSTKVTGEDGEELENLFEQYDEEIRRINQEYSGKIKNTIFPYASVEDVDGNPHVFMSANAQFKIPVDLFKNIKKFKDNTKLRATERIIEEVVKETTKELGIYDMGWLNISHQNDLIIINISVEPDVFDNTPDDYRDFYQSLKQDWDDQYDTIERGILYGLQQAEILKSNFFVGIDKIYEHESFLHFNWDINEYILEIESEPIHIYRDSELSKIELNFNILKNISEISSEEIKKILSDHIKKFFVDNNPVFEQVKSFMPPKVDINKIQIPTVNIKLARFSGNTFVTILFLLDPRQSDEQLKITEQYIRLLDNNFNELAVKIQEVFQYNTTQTLRKIHEEKQKEPDKIYKKEQKKALNKTAQHKDWYNTDVAKDPNTSPEILAKILEKENDDHISWNAAQNPNCPPEALAKVLERGKDNWVSHFVARNLNCPSEALVKVLEKGKNDLVSGFAAQNPNCPFRAKIDWMRAIGQIKTEDENSILEEQEQLDNSDLEKFKDLLK